VVSIIRKVKERRSLSYLIFFPLSFEGEGERGGEVDKKSPDYAKISKQRPLSEEFYR